MTLTTFSLFPSLIDRVSPNRGLKLHSEADSSAKRSERLTSRRPGWLGAVAARSSPHSLFCLLFLLFVHVFILISADKLRQRWDNKIIVRCIGNGTECQSIVERSENAYCLTRANCRRAEKYRGIVFKSQCPFALEFGTLKSLDNLPSLPPLKKSRFRLETFGRFSKLFSVMNSKAKVL